MNRLRESPGFLLPTPRFGVKLGPVNGISSPAATESVNLVNIPFEIPFAVSDDGYDSLNPIAGLD